jgi:hypothetical protein
MIVDDRMTTMKKEGMKKKRLGRYCKRRHHLVRCLHRHR